VFAQRDEHGRERIYLRFRDLAPVNRALRQTGYAHDELVDPVTHCPVCGKPNRPSPAIALDETQSPGPVPVSQLLLADQRACARADHDRRTP